MRKALSSMSHRTMTATVALVLFALAGCQVGKPGVLQTRIIEGTKRHLTVRGRVSGTIRAVNVKLRGSAAVDGEIFHQTLLVEEDADFDGASRPLVSG